MGTIIDNEPTPIPETVSKLFPTLETAHLTSDESTRENGAVASSDGSGLDNNTDDEDCDVHQNGVLSREDLGEETRVHGTEPGTQFENRHEPTLLGRVVRQGNRVLNVRAHVCAHSLAQDSEAFEHMAGGLTPLERVHDQDTREDTLVVTVKETSQTREAGNAKDLQVLHQGHGPSRRVEGLAASQSGCLNGAGSSSDGCHD
jgi:hypothetical protein